MSDDGEDKIMTRAEALELVRRTELPPGYEWWPPRIERLIRQAADDVQAHYLATTFAEAMARRREAEAP